MCHMFSGCSGDLVYHLPIVRGFWDWTIVHLELVKTLLTARLFKYHWSFWFVTFCIYCECALSQVNIKVILSILECLVHNDRSAYMIENYVSAIKAHFILYD